MLYRMRATLAFLLLPLAQTSFSSAQPAQPAALEELRQSAGQAAQASIPEFKASAVQDSRLSAANQDSPQAILAGLHELTGRGLREQSYDAARGYMFSTCDNVLRDGVRGVIDAYSNVFVPGTSAEGNDYREEGDRNGDGFMDKEGMNVEHTWPQSFFNKRTPMKSDLHHLLPTFIHPNSVRGSMPFGKVSGRGDYSNNGGAKAAEGVFEPPDEAKGRVARALLYFYTRYYDRDIDNGGFGPEFWSKNLELLLRWNREFPPSRDELRRNDLIESFQGNRNPFVDEPGLADKIGADGFRLALRLGSHIQN
ncbi:MAG: endonuclease [Elusimicrobia bacterium]|nr:endonuclease [Elusimicrobiota bacterium]